MVTRPGKQQRHNGRTFTNSGTIARPRYCCSRIIRPPAVETQQIINPCCSRPRKTKRGIIDYKQQQTRLHIKYLYRTTTSLEALSQSVCSIRLWNHAGMCPNSYSTLSPSLRSWYSTTISFLRTIFPGEALPSKILSSLPSSSLLVEGL